MDVYHVWWNPDLQLEFECCGKSGYLFAFHICDWMTPTVDILNDWGLKGKDVSIFRKSADGLKMRDLTATIRWNFSQVGGGRWIKIHF